MNIYLVRNKEAGSYLHVWDSARYTWWINQQEATVFTESEDAHDAGMHAFGDDDHVEEKFDIVHLVALRPGIDPYAITGDKEPIGLGLVYYLPTKDGLQWVYAREIVYQNSGRRSSVFVRTDLNDLLVKPGDLYKTEAAARHARFKKMANMGMYVEEKDEA